MVEELERTPTEKEPMVEELERAQIKGPMVEELESAQIKGTTGRRA